MDKAMLSIVKAEAKREYEESHKFKKSESVHNSFVAYHEDGSICHTETPCYHRLFLKDLGVKLEIRQ